MITTTTRPFPLLVACLALAACATASTENPDAGAPTMTEAAASAVDQTSDGLTDAALSPLEDFNLRRQPIPATLKSLATPYSDTEAMACPDIAAEIALLDADLGRDWDTPAPEDDKEESRAEWAAARSSDAALGAVSSQARGFIPFRGLVREATGAQAYAARVERAYRLGAQRRAFLKGVGQAKGCPPPAAPRPIPAEDEPIVFRQHQGRQ